MNLNNDIVMNERQKVRRVWEWAGAVEVKLTYTRVVLFKLKWLAKRQGLGDGKTDADHPVTMMWYRY